jgi:MOSC domain-containing protein YiiM
MTQRITIAKIMVRAEKKSAGVELTEGFLHEGHGLEGDYFAGEGERQFSLITVEAQTALCEGEAGLCTGRYKANIVLDSISVDELEPGKQFRAGDAAFEITGAKKNCYEECNLPQNGKRCRISGKHLFAKVTSRGKITRGDEVMALTNNCAM